MWLQLRHVLAENVPQLGLAQDQEVIETLAPRTAEAALAGGVLARCPVRLSWLPSPSAA